MHIYMYVYVYVYIYTEREYLRVCSILWNNSGQPRLGGITSPSLSTQISATFLASSFPPPLSAFPLPFSFLLCWALKIHLPVWWRLLPPFLLDLHPLIMLTPQNSHSFFSKVLHSLFSCPCYSYKYFLHCLWKVQSEKKFLGATCCGKQLGSFSKS